MKLNALIIIIFVKFSSLIHAQFSHSVFAGPSITKNRLLLHKVEPQEFAVYEGPSYKLFYNLGYRLKYQFSKKFGVGIEAQWKKIGSDRFYRHIITKDAFQNTWQNYISAPLYIIYSPSEKVSFDLGFTSNYRLDEAESITPGGPVFDIRRKYKSCFDILFDLNLFLTKRIDLRIRWEEGLDVIDGPYMPEYHQFAVKNRAYHFSLVFKL